jgi:ABC-type uncharacterized transport system involved in gliding motility auxiliary subunit
MPPMPGAGGPRLIVDQLGEFFEVEELTPDIDAVPETVKVLMIIDLSILDEDALRAVDRFVYEGGRALVFVDPLIESTEGGMPREPGARAGDMEMLLEAWGVRLVEDRVAGDLATARQVSAGGINAPVASYLPWLELGADRFDQGDPIFANIERINVASAGILEPTDGAEDRVLPIIQTTSQSQAIEVDKLRFRPDIVALLRDFKSDDASITLAARVSGDARPAFPSDQATSEEPDPDAPADGTTDGEAGGGATRNGDEAAADDADSVPDPPAKPIEVVVVADIDMLYDRFWVTVQEFFGRQLYQPTANNADLVVNTIENLGGDPVLVGLRGRGTSDRPFKLLDEIRQQAELRFRAQENRLQDRLSALEQRLVEVEARAGPTGEILLTEDDTRAIDQFRAEQVSVRRELRDVQHALRSDIESIQGLIKVLNIAVVPALLCFGALIVFGIQRSRRSAARRMASASRP